MSEKYKGRAELFKKHMELDPLNRDTYNISTFVKLQTAWNQEQGPQKWTLIMVPACLPVELHTFINYFPENTFLN